MTSADRAEEGVAPWWQGSVVYQIYPRSFADSNGDGIGDLPGITAHLDHLAWLGVDVIWLSPIYVSPHDDNGYDISDYRDIDPIYGTLADFDVLLDEVHRRGMKLIMDLVVNHTSDDHPWFIESRSSRTSPKRDWYWWRPPRPGMEPGAAGAEPNNWEAHFSGSVWELDEVTGEYYLHLFSRRQPDLNWENPEVRHAVYDMMRWWLGRGIDGFRMDVINSISKDTALPDGALRPGARFGDGAPYYLGGPRVHEFLQEMHREVFAGHGRRLLTVGETPGVTVEEALRFTDPDRHEVDMVFQFDHMDVDHGSTQWERRPLRLTDLKAVLRRWQEGLRDRGWNSLYWNNHDQTRIVSRFGDDGEYRVRSATMLATILHLHRGTPYVYQGEEIGMTNAPVSSIDDVRDIRSVNFYAEATAGGADPAAVLAAIAECGRDNARTPMQWDDSPNGGFSAATPWLGVNPNFTSINVAAARADPDSILHYYRRLIALRAEEPVVRHGGFTMLLPGDEHVYAFTRHLDGTEFLVAGNFSAEEQPLAGRVDPAWAEATLVLGNVAGAGGALAPLRPWEARVYQRP